MNNMITPTRDAPTIDREGAVRALTGKAQELRARIDADLVTLATIETILGHMGATPNGGERS